MINLTNAEQWTLNILDNTINSDQKELQRAIASKAAYIKLLESKYDAEYDAEKGQFKSKGKEKK